MALVQLCAKNAMLFWYYFDVLNTKKISVFFSTTALFLKYLLNKKCALGEQIII